MPSARSPTEWRGPAAREALRTDSVCPGERARLPIILDAAADGETLLLVEAAGTGRNYAADHARRERQNTHEPSGKHTLAFGERLLAIPISAIWETTL